MNEFWATVFFLVLFLSVYMKPTKKIATKWAASIHLEASVHRNSIVLRSSVKTVQSFNENKNVSKRNRNEKQTTRRPQHMQKDNIYTGKQLSRVQLILGTVKKEEKNAFLYSVLYRLKMSLVFFFVIWHTRLSTRRERNKKRKGKEAFSCVLSSQSRLHVCAAICK